MDGDIDLNVEKSLQGFREHLPINNVDWLDVRVLGSEAMVKRKRDQCLLIIRAFHRTVAVAPAPALALAPAPGCNSCSWYQCNSLGPGCCT